MPLDRWNYSSFLQGGNFRLHCERRAERCEEASPLSLSLLFSLLSHFANYRHPRSHLLFRSVLRRGRKYLSWLLLPPGTARSSFRLFFVKRDSRASEGDLIGRVFQTAESPRPSYGRGDLIKTERNEPRKTTGVHLSGSRGSGLLFLRSSFYLAISGLCFGLTEQQTSDDYFYPTSLRSSYMCHSITKILTHKTNLI